ncbi:hypothetical protein AAE478_002241 [Parahypoxylon ruwenzoriense]
MEPKDAGAEHSRQHQLSHSTKILVWIILPAIFVGLGIALPLTATLAAFTFIPTLCLVWYDRARPLDERVDFETFIWTFVLTGTVGTVAVAVVQLILSYVLALAFFQSAATKFLEEVQRGEDEVAKLDSETLAVRRQMASQWQYWVLMLAFAFFAAGLPEEVLKYSGLITFENIGFLYAATQANHKSWELALTLVERVVVASLMHAMSGLLIDLDAERRDFHEEAMGLS